MIYFYLIVNVLATRLGGRQVRVYPRKNFGQGGEKEIF